MGTSPMAIVLPTPEIPEHFDYRRAASDAGFSPIDLRAVQVLFEADYPSNLMLRELHILRACTLSEAAP